MNKKGSVVIFGLMLGLTIIILTLSLAPVVQEFTEAARNETAGDIAGLDCSNDSISNFNKAACVATDISLFYFIGALIFISGLVITSKVVFG